MQTLVSMYDSMYENRRESGHMRFIILGLALAGFLSACSDENATTKNEPTSSSELQTEAVVLVSESEKLNHWFNDKFAEELSKSPIRTTMLGRRDNYDQIDDASEIAEIDLLKWREGSVTELKANFDYAALSVDAKVSYDIWVYQYESAKAREPYRRHAYMFTQMQGVQSFLPEFLINFHKVEDVSDMMAYVSRIGGISRALGQFLERAEVAATQGIRPPRFAYVSVIKEARNQLIGVPFDTDSKNDAPLWRDAKSKIEALRDGGKIDETEASELTIATREALLESFRPAYLELINWFESDIENTSSVAEGVYALPDGQAYYNSVLLHHTTVLLTAAEIHETGLSEVARILEEMESIKQQVEFEGSLKDFFTFIKHDKQLFYSNDDEGRKRYISDTANYLAFIKEKLPNYFGILPQAKLVVKRVESFRERDGGPAHYFPGTPDGSRPGVYYMHLPNMDFSTASMESIAYHEGNPGHHMQISIAQELTSVPEFRTQAKFTSFSEGWGLYAENLAKEMGAFNDPYMDFGRLNQEMLRAIRLVVDTGIHSKGWTEEQAVTYIIDNSALDESFIRSEVRRYFVWPGQATSYKIGMLKLLELRARAEQELGDRFDIRGFHDSILGAGEVPLPILEKLVDNWIPRQ
jgi:uncharacterized protein (DUF885 family)